MTQPFNCFVCFEEKNFEITCNGCHKGELCTDCYDSLSFPKTCPLCRFQEFPDDNGSEDQSDEGDYVGAFISHFNNHLRQEILRERNETFRAFRRLFGEHEEEDSDDEESDDEDSDDDGEAFDSLFEPPTPDSEHDGLFPTEEDPYERYEYEMMNTPHVYGYY
jgi:hypothetical protein